MTMMSVLETRLSSVVLKRTFIDAIHEAAADWIGVCANERARAWTDIVDYWRVEGGDRLPGLELEDLARLVVRLILERDMEIPTQVFTNIESLLDQTYGTDLYEDLAGGFLGSSFFETLDVLLKDYEDDIGADRLQELRRKLSEITGEETKIAFPL